MSFKKYIFIFSYIFFLCSPSFAGEIYFIDINGVHEIEGKYLEVASKYYGIDIVRCSGRNDCLEEMSNSIKNKTIDAIAVSANSLSDINYSEYFKRMTRSEKNIPLMILGISPENEGDVKIWSDGSIKGVSSISSMSEESFYLFSRNYSVTRQLAGLSLRGTKKFGNYLDLESEDNNRSLMYLYFEGDNRKYPVFAEIVKNDDEIFFLSKIVPEDAGDDLEYATSRSNFYEIAPFMMFLKHACKERCWHSTNYFANLTIDDPWIREPYGNLSYRNLLREMNKENFHTTIAFIPWNYDRSDTSLIPLIRNNLNRYSIVIHGNDHNHQEFYPLNKNNGTQENEDLKNYEGKIQQALARMGKFKEMTGIPYDKIMVFPHRVAPRYAFRLLKNNGYLATANANNVPLDSLESNDPANRFRCVTTDFEGIASYRRKEVFNFSKEYVAIELFLDNPILLYTHQDFFAENISNFNPIAEYINKLQPDVIWGSLGYIIRNYHLEKVRDDGNIDILMFASTLNLTNDSNSSSKYFIKKKEPEQHNKLLHILVNGEPVSYHYNNDNEYVSFEVDIPKGKTLEIKVNYDSDMTSVKNSLGTKNFYFGILRYVSDFRDIVLSKYKYGRIIIGNYYKPGSYKIIIVLGIGFVGLFILAFAYIYKNKA